MSITNSVSFYDMLEEGRMRYRAQLDWLNFFLADVRGGLGPYVGVFLLTQAHWDRRPLVRRSPRVG